jgi:broad-specificity NMP kinase
MVKTDVWMKSGNTFRQISSDFTIEKTVPVGIYNVDLVPFTGWVLNIYAEKFNFDYKLYDLQNDFIDHVCKTYNSTNGNLGILLNGTKGTGKTVTAKELANALNLPIIIVKNFGDRNQDLIEFLSTLNFDCVFFFDEFEKNFDENDSTILQIMDGVYNSENRRVFLLTTNTMDINSNLIGRPSRIRYVKTFGNLDLKVVKAYLNDNLEDKSCYAEVIEFIDSLTISTIDILKTIVNEINIHGINDFRKSKSFFNVKNNEYNYQIYMSRLTPREYESDMETGGKIFTIPKFIEIAEARKKYDDTRIRCITNEEYEKNGEEYDSVRKTNPFNNCDYRTMCSEVKFQGMREGVGTEYGTIIKIDYSNNVIIVRDDDEEGYDDIRFIQILNPSAKPSLYGSYRSGYKGAY